MRPLTSRGRLRGRSGRVAAAFASLVVLIGTPAVVVALASGQDIAPVAAGVRPASPQPLRPAAPFFAGAGDGVRPDGIGCTSSARIVLRARAHLDLFAGGRRVTVPAGIGALATCRYWVGTRDATGVVTVASPERRAFTLGDLFDIWGAPLGRHRLLAFAPAPVRVFVDGRRVPGDPRAVALRDGAEVALVVGSAPARVPRGFAFPP